MINTCVGFCSKFHTVFPTLEDVSFCKCFLYDVHPVDSAQVWEHGCKLNQSINQSIKHLWPEAFLSFFEAARCWTSAPSRAALPVGNTALAALTCPVSATPELHHEGGRVLVAGRGLQRKLLAQIPICTCLHKQLRLLPTQCRQLPRSARMHQLSPCPGPAGLWTSLARSLKTSRAGLGLRQALQCTMVRHSPRLPQNTQEAWQQMCLMVPSQPMTCPQKRAGPARGD